GLLALPAQRMKRVGTPTSVERAGPRHRAERLAEQPVDPLVSGQLSPKVADPGQRQARRYSDSALRFLDRPDCLRWGIGDCAPRDRRDSEPFEALWFDRLLRSERLRSSFPRG